VTTPKVSTIKRGGARFYVNPDDATVKYPGVTSILGMLPKDFLRYWASKMVAECAVEELGTVVQMTLRDPAAAIDHLKKAPDRNTRKAADIGTAAHDLFELMARGKPIGRVHPDLEPFVRHFDEYLRVVKPEYHFLEETVWSDKHQYAGSFDAFATIDGEKVWVDNKTTRSGIHEEVGLQLAAYGNADSIIRQDGGRVPMPESDGGVVLHIRPEGWQLVPVRADREMFDVFLHLREVFRYEKEIKSTVVGRAAYSGPADADEPTGPKRRTPKAAAPRKAPSAASAA
jgi:hypothetical protein